MRFLAAHFMVVAALTSPALAQPDTANDPDIGVYAFSGGRGGYIQNLPDIQGPPVVEVPRGRARPPSADGRARFHPPPPHRRPAARRPPAPPPPTATRPP